MPRPSRANRTLSDLRAYARHHGLEDRLERVLALLGPDRDAVLRWARSEATRRVREGEAPAKADLSKVMYRLVAWEAAIRLVRHNYERGRLTTKTEVRQKTGLKVDMPQLYRDAGLRHPQEARNLRHNMFHEAFMALVRHLFPDTYTTIPTTGEGLTPDLLVHHRDPDWTISVEYKGYRFMSLLSESELLKVMRYQQAYGSAWLVTTTNKTVHHLYGSEASSRELVEQGIPRLRCMVSRKTYTDEQRESRGIAKKGIVHLEKHRDMDIRCAIVSAEELVESCRRGRPLRAVAVTTGLEFVDMLMAAGLRREAEDVLQVMKVPAVRLSSDTVTSLRLIDDRPR